MSQRTKILELMQQRINDYESNAKDAALRGITGNPANEASEKDAARKWLVRRDEMAMAYEIVASNL